MHPPRVRAGDILLNIAVNLAYEVGQIFSGFIKSPERSLIKSLALRMTNHEAVKTAPVIIEMLHKIIEQMSVAKKNLGPGYGFNDEVGRSFSQEKKGLG